MNLVVAQPPVKAELQAQLKKAITAIDNKIKKISGDSSYVFKAPSAFKYNELDGNVVNIQTCVDTNYLVKALSKMKRVEAEYNQTMKDLGVETYQTCKWLNTPINLWIEDLSVIVRRVVNRDTINALTQKKTELSQFMSADEKLTNILTDLNKLMANK